MARFEIQKSLRTASQPANWPKNPIVDESYELGPQKTAILVFNAPFSDFWGQKHLKTSHVRKPCESGHNMKVYICTIFSGLVILGGWHLITNPAFFSFQPTSRGGVSLPQRHWSGAGGKWANDWEFAIGILGRIHATRPGQRLHSYGKSHFFYG